MSRPKASRNRGEKSDVWLGRVLQVSARYCLTICASAVCSGSAVVVPKSASVALCKRQSNRFSVLFHHYLLPYYFFPQRIFFFFLSVLFSLDSYVPLSKENNH